MATLDVKCPGCCGLNVTKHGTLPSGEQRYRCNDPDCDCQTFILNYKAVGRLPETKEKIIDMAMNGSGIRDTARVLKISPTTVIEELKKKEPFLDKVNQHFLSQGDQSELAVIVKKVEDSEMDEMWSFVQKKVQQRWLWHAIDRISGKVLAYTFGTREDMVFLELQQLLQPFGISKFYTDDWGAYKRHIDPQHHVVGKKHTQKIERKHLTFRTRIKRLARKTICFSKTIQMHDIVVGLFINRFEFWLAV